jgi:hypothetical protein
MSCMTTFRKSRPITQRCAEFFAAVTWTDDLAVGRLGSWYCRDAGDKSENDNDDRPHDGLNEDFVN